MPDVLPTYEQATSRDDRFNAMRAHIEANSIYNRSRPSFLTVAARVAIAAGATFTLANYGGSVAIAALLGLIFAPHATWTAIGADSFYRSAMCGLTAVALGSLPHVAYTVGLFALGAYCITGLTAPGNRF